MDAVSHQPGPLRVTKSVLNTNSANDADGPPDGVAEKQLHRQAQAAGQRNASVATDESKGSVRGDPGASQRRLAIPKKRQPLPTWHDDGTGRFYSPSASYSATMIRRNHNATDNTGPGSGNDDLGFRDQGQRTDGIRQMSAYNEPDVCERYGSIGTQFAQAGFPERGGQQQQQHMPAQPQHARHSQYLDEDVAEHFRRMSIRPDDPFYSGKEASYDPMQTAPYADPQSQYWSSAVPPEFGRQASMAATGPGHFDPYGSQTQTYGRPMSMDPASAIPSMANMFPREPIARAATTAPFENRYRHQSRMQMQQSQYGSPQRHMHAADPADQRLSSRLSQFGGTADADSMPGPDPRILVPMISITPECRAVEGEVNSFWVAIELFANITQPLDTVPLQDRACQASTPSFSLGEDQELYQFGYISGLDIKILPSYQAEILEVIGKSPSLLTLLPGSRRLMVVHVHLDTAKGKSRHNPQEYRPPSQKNRSDQLLEDLELQLGATSQEYMQVQLKYSHSGFPKRHAGRDATGRGEGCVEVRTTIETTATALVMQQNTSSMWSPRSAPTSSPLVDIVAKH